ncbi:TetR/AcrR family transcriptional regulator [Paenibacillus donghaensis]|nr:TetR/AcrR family transcriptional regulator [Paenibacillus donghaensis]
MARVMQREQEKAIRRSRIIEAAEGVFFGTSYIGATMEDIAKAASISKRTLYIYFNSKEQLYFEIMIRGYRQLLSMLEEDLQQMGPGSGAMDKLAGLGRLLYEFSRCSPEYYRAIMEYETAEMDFNQGIEDAAREECYALGEQLNRHLTETLLQGIQEGVLRNDLDVVQTALVLWASLIGVLNTVRLKENYITHIHGVAADELVSSAIELMMQSIRVQERRILDEEEGA